MGRRLETFPCPHCHDMLVLLGYKTTGYDSLGRPRKENAIEQVVHERQLEPLGYTDGGD